MDKNKWWIGAALAIPAAAGALAYTQARTEAQPAAKAAGYVCPLTGETLPCPDCCPLNGQ